MTVVTKFISGTWRQNGYVVSTDQDAVVIDPGGEFEAITTHVTLNALRVHAVINTHAHYDHLGAVDAVKARYEVPFYLHPADKDLLQRANFYRTLFLGQDAIAIPQVDLELVDSMKLQFGQLGVAVVHTPGHTPGSVCFEVDGELFTGDTIMAEHLGRTDLPGGDRDVLLSSVDRLREGYPPEMVVRPGHGDDATLRDVLARVAVLPELRG